MGPVAPYWICFGDVHGHVRSLSRIPGLKEAAGVIISGDLTVKGGVREARAVIEAVAVFNPRILAQIGNMDYESVHGWLVDEGLNIHGRAVELAPGLGLMGVGWSSPTPFGTPSEVPDSQLAEWLADTYEQAGHFERLILVCHTPPYATKADELRPGTHVGSKAVREFIERVQPDLCLTGHIHEAKSVDAIGHTTIINPGELAAGGYVAISFDGRTLTPELRHVFRAGM